MRRSHFTYDLFTWSVATVFARQNQIQLEGKNGPVEGLALIPVYDMLNHEGISNLQITSDFDYEKKALRMFAVRDFKQGEQIKIFYGPRPNRDFFLYQGFTLPTNPNNYTAVGFQLLATDKLREQKSKFLSTKEIPENAKYLSSVSEPVSPALLGFMRLALITNEADLAKAENAFQGQMISIENEEKVLTMLEIKFTQVHNDFPTKIEVDIEEQKKTTRLDYHIYQILIDEKRILASAIKCIKEKKKKLAKKKENKINHSSNICEQCCKNVATYRTKTWLNSK